jgi:hypothetical protein
MFERRAPWAAGLALSFVAAGAALVASAAAAPAASPAGDDTPSVAALTVDQQFGGKRGGAEKGEPKSSANADWAKATKDSKPVDGLFRIYKGKSTWHLQLNPDQLDRQYLMSLTVGRGIGSKFLVGGLLLYETVIRFQKAGDKVLLLKDDPRFVAPGDSSLMRSIQLSFAPSVAHSFKIAGESKDTLLVDFTELVLSDFAGITEFWAEDFGGKPRVDDKRSTLGALQAFPKNVEMDGNLTLIPGNREKAQVRTVSDDRYVPVTVHYALMDLPEPGYTPRLLDDRVGYFPTSLKDFTRDDNESYFVHYANRWRLQKKDPSAALSEPVQPIVFYIENTIPEKWRPYIKEGVEAWNKAFEAAGFKNAILAKDQPDDPEWDAADVRYSSIRWISSSEPSFGAIGPSRIDPRTGEIFDADILIEASWILGHKNTYRRWAGPETVEEALDGMPRAALAKGFNRNTCRYGMGAFDNANLVNVSMHLDGLLPPDQPVPDEFIGQSLVELTLHEVGHTLGLRHNFQSSVSVPADRLGDREWVMTRGITGSVMDYPTPYVEENAKSGHLYYTQVPGPYDIWAIRYGYTPTVAASPWDEKSFLQDIAEESSKPGHEYGTDEDTYPLFALDPRNNIFDLGNDPLDFGERRANYLSALWSKPDYTKRVLAEGDGYQSLRGSVTTLMFQYARSLSFGLKYVGGQTVSRAHYGDPGAPQPLSPVAAAEQRRALQFLTKMALGPEAMQCSPALLNQLLGSRNWDWETNLFQERIDFPYYQYKLGLQEAVLFRLLEPYRLVRIREAETRQSNALTVSELFQELTGAVWGEFGVGSMNALARQSPAVAMRATTGPDTRRDLQRFYVDLLIDWVVNPAAPGTDDARALARLHLTRIDAACARGLTGPAAASDVVQAHLLETRARIRRAFEAQMESKG